MKACARQLLSGCLAVSLLIPVPAAFAQASRTVAEAQYAPAAAATAYTQQELDQMLAPIALYPDDLLTQILMASTYPLELVQAARWSRANPGFGGDQAVRAVEQQNWDPSVKSLVAFPQILELMDGSLDWTERLGNAFLSQEAQLWDTVQDLRQRADAAGNLRSNDQLRVEQEGPTYVIESPRPDIVYVPYYDPLVVYGNWWWPGYEPMRWSPWPGYYVRPGFGGGYYWGNGISVGFGFFFGGIDWRERRVNVSNHNSFYYRNVNRRPSGNHWQHDPDHRRGVPYRDPLLRQQFTRGPATPNSPDARRDFRGRLPEAVPRGEQGDRGQPRPVRPGTNAVQGPVTSAGPRPAYAPGSRAPGSRPAQKYPAEQTGGARPYQEHRPQALEGIGRGQDARNASARGQASLPSRPPVQQRQPTPQPQRVAPAPAQQATPQQQPQPAPSPHNPPRQRGEPQK